MIKACLCVEQVLYFLSILSLILHSQITGNDSILDNASCLRQKNFDFFDQTN